MSHFSSPKWVWWDTLATQPVEKQNNCTYCFFPPGKPFRSCFLNLFPLHVGPQSFRTKQVTSPSSTKGLTGFLIFLAGSLKSSLIIQSLPPKCWDDRENHGTMQEAILVYTVKFQTSQSYTVRTLSPGKKVITQGRQCSSRREVNNSQDYKNEAITTLTDIIIPNIIQDISVDLSNIILSCYVHHLPYEDPVPNTLGKHSVTVNQGL